MRNKVQKRCVGIGFRHELDRNRALRSRLCYDHRRGCRTEDRHIESRGTKRDARRAAELALMHRLPAVSVSRSFSEAVGRMSYSPRQVDLYRHAAGYVDKILRGAKPSDLPVQQPTNFELVINLKTAKALELKIADTLLFTADELIK